MKAPSAQAILAFVLFPLFASMARAQEPSIDRLLSKLPPPEKIVKPQIVRRGEMADPVMRDPLVAQITSALRSRGSIGRAVKFSHDLTAKYPQSAAALCVRGLVAVDAREFGDAATSFRGAIALRPNFTSAHLGLAEMEGSQNHYAAAIPHLQRYVQIEPDAVVGWYALSDCALRTGRKADAVTYARRAAALAGSNVFVWIQLARAEKAAGHSEETLRAIAKAAEISPDSAEMLAVVGLSYINLGQIRQAIPPLARAARLAPNNFLLEAQLGFCLQSVGQVDDGIAHLKAGARLAPNYPPVWEHLGLAYQKKGLHRDAVKAFERAAKIMPTYRPTWQHLAEEYRAVGDAAGAEKAAGRARALPAGRPMPMMTRS